MKDTEIQEATTANADAATTEETPDAERFTIDTEDKADWVLSKLASIEAEKARIRAQADKRIKELTADHAGLVARFGDELKAWARGEATRRRRQTVTLFNGALAFENQSARLIIADPLDAITTAKAVCPSAVVTETVEKFDATAFLKYAEARLSETGGEILPGCEWKEATEAFFIRPAKGAKE